MFIPELKKIWKKERILLIALIVFVFTAMFLLPQIRFVTVTHEGEDAFGTRTEITRDWILRYGEEITPQEFEQIEQRYAESLSAGQDVISTESCFAENQVFSYDDYLTYMQNALNGAEGYSYDILRKMRDYISANTAYSAMYYQEYERLMEYYENSIERKEYANEMKLSGRAKETAASVLVTLRQAEGQGSPLPDEFVFSANRYFVYISVLCMILTLFIAAPVMVNDNGSNIRQGQYSSKTGRKIYRIQYLSMLFSLSVFTAALLSGYLLLWRNTGAKDFYNCSIFSFQITEIPVFTGIGYGKYIGIMILLVFVLTNGIGGIVFYLSGTSHNYIEMLMKTLPVIFVGILLSLSLEDALFNENLFFRMTGIRGMEFIPVGFIFIAGILINLKGSHIQDKRQL